MSLLSMLPEGLAGMTYAALHRVHHPLLHASGTRGHELRRPVAPPSHALRAARRSRPGATDTHEIEANVLPSSSTSLGVVVAERALSGPLAEAEHIDDAALCPCPSCRIRHRRRFGHACSQLGAEHAGEVQPPVSASLGAISRQASRRRSRATLCCEEQ